MFIIKEILIKQNGVFDLRAFGLDGRVSSSLIKGLEFELSLGRC
jgi:hypothetical protein